jgi:hypothetical protein
MWNLSPTASLARFLTPDSARAVLQRAATHQDRVVRVAAAASLERQPELVDELMGPLLTDPDLGVRKWMLRSLEVLHALRGFETFYNEHRPHPNSRTGSPAPFTPRSEPPTKCRSPASTSTGMIHSAASSGSINMQLDADG